MQPLALRKTLVTATQQSDSGPAEAREERSPLPYFEPKNTTPSKTRISLAFSCLEEAFRFRQQYALFALRHNRFDSGTSHRATAESNLEQVHLAAF